MVVNMSRALVLTLASVLLSLAACGGNNPPSGGDSSGTGDTVSGRESFGWTQSAQTAADLAAYKYALYVDNQRRVVEGETCSTTGGTSVECSAPLPSLGAGRHALQLAAFFMSGETVVEGERSTVLQVTVAGVVAPAGGQIVKGGSFVSSDGLGLNASILARDLLEPSDLAVAPDGRVFVAERGGRLRIVAEGGPTERSEENLLEALGETPGAEGTALLSVAPAPDFQTSGALFVAYVAIERGRRELSIVRLRETAGLLGQAAVIASHPVAAADASALVRFDPDGRLHVGIGSGSVSAEAQNLSAASGKILRLRNDGTTPEDNPSSSPVFSAGHSDPRGLAWLPQDQSMWEVERAGDGDEVNRIQTGANYGWPIAQPGSVQSSMAVKMTPPILVLAPGTEASGLTSVAQPDSPLFGDLIVSTLGSRDLLRFRFESSGRLRLSGQLLQGRYGRIAQVASGRDGSLYFITANREEWGEGQDVLVRVRVPAHERVPPGPRN